MQNNQNNRITASRRQRKSQHMLMIVLIEAKYSDLCLPLQIHIGEVPHLRLSIVIRNNLCCRPTGIGFRAKQNAFGYHYVFLMTML